MTNYNDGKWHGWNGGECPVHPETVVDVTTWSDYDFEQNSRSKGVIGINAYRSISAGKILWRDIIAFRVIKEYKDPREFWCVLKNMHSTKEEAEKFLAALERENPGLDFGKVFHVREVIE